MSKVLLGTVWVWSQCLLMPQSLSTLSFIVDKCLPSPGPWWLRSLRDQTPLWGGYERTDES